MRGRGERVLYLDFDGVLHHENVLWSHKKGAYISAPARYSLFQHMSLLEELLAPYPKVRIVLSTSWVRVYSYSRALKRLSPQLRERVVGATWHSQMCEEDFQSKPRGVQVEEDVARRRPIDWLALDDDAKEWPKSCIDKLVKTHDYEGLSDPDVLVEFKDKLRRLSK